MAEPISRFVTRRRPDWDALEQLLEKQRRGELQLPDLERLDKLYRSAAADLAHAQAHHAGSEAHRHLNQLCARAYGAIYQPPKDRWGAVRRFYRSEFPAAVIANLRFIAASAVIFGLGLLVGALVVGLEPRGAEILVPDSVRSAVARREMWTDALFSITPPGLASSAIATNNLTVTFVAFALGLTLGLGTVFVLLNNGLHLGAVAAFCAREGMGLQLLAFVGAHGFVELSIIVIAGGAGLILGHSLIDPGELPRAQALRRRGREAVKLVVGCAPFLAAIGFVEGFISPLAIHWQVKVALGAILGLAFWAYLLMSPSFAQRLSRGRAATGASAAPSHPAARRSGSS